MPPLRSTAVRGIGAVLLWYGARDDRKINSTLQARLVSSSACVGVAPLFLSVKGSFFVVFVCSSRQPLQYRTAVHAPKLDSNSTYVLRSHSGHADLNGWIYY